MNIIFARVVRGAVWKLLFYVSSFILNIVLANFLGANGSGSLFYLLNNLGIAALLLSFGLENTVSYFYSKKILSKDLLYIFSIIWSALATIFFWLLLQFFPSLYQNSILQVSEFFLLVYVFGATCNTLISALDYAQHKAVLANSIPAVLNILCMLFLFGWFRINGSANAADVAIPVLLIPFITAFFLILKRLNFGNVQWKLLKTIPKHFWMYSMQVYLAALCLGLFTRVDIWVVGNFCSKMALGNYILTTKFAQLTLFIPLLASFSLFPSYTQYAQRGTFVQHSVLQFSNLYFYLVLAFCTVVNIISQWLFPFLYGPTFVQMPELFLLATPGIIAFATSYPFVSYFGASNQNITTFRAAGEGLFIIVLSNVLLTPTAGIYGAAISFSIANLYFLFRIFYFFNKAYPFSFVQLFSIPLLLQSINQMKKSIK
jgi:O-antigen/teichoic acid export membrane protein